jgi:toluene monooxygenase system ferredoxin subunit
MPVAGPELNGGEATMWKKVCDSGAVAPGAMKQFDVEGGPQVLILNVDGQHYAYQAYCPHEAVRLEDGVCDGAVLTCLEHLWQFDAKTGAPVGDDADTGLQGFRLKDEAGSLHVWVE